MDCVPWRSTHRIYCNRTSCVHCHGPIVVLSVPALRLDDMDLASQSPEHLKSLGYCKIVMQVKHDLILTKAAQEIDENRVGKVS